MKLKKVKKKPLTLTFEVKDKDAQKITAKKIVKLGKTLLIPNQNKDSTELFFWNNKRGEKIPKGELIVTGLNSKIQSLILSNNGTVRATVQFSVKELESLLKEAKKRKKEFKGRFFIHPSPDFSVFFKE